VGVRYVVDQVSAEEEGKDAVVYEGFAHLSDVSIPLHVDVTRDGAAASLDPAAALSVEQRRELEKEASALVRSATKGALASGAALPRRISRWRRGAGEKREPAKKIDPAGGT
jgi:hypothetical protein